MPVIFPDRSAVNHRVFPIRDDSVGITISDRGLKGSVDAGLGFIGEPDADPEIRESCDHRRNPKQFRF